VTHEKSDWWKATDVVIAGYGAAGAAAAIAAHDAGARVLILEKMDAGGGNTVVSMGGFLCPAGVDDAIGYISRLYDFSHCEKDDAMIRAFAEEAAGNVAWVKSLKEGTEVHIYGHASFPQVPGADAMEKYLVKGKQKGSTAFARNLWEVLTHAVERERRIPVLTGTPVKRLVTTDAGAVLGVTAEHEGRTVDIRADRAVILSTGGYEFDASTIRNHLKGFPIYAAGSPGNTGDGVRMAQKAGAALWHMNAVSCGLGLKVDEFASGFLAVIDAPGHIIVDRKGRRFMNERGMEAHAGLLAVDHYDSQHLEYPRIPCFAVFDEATRRRGPISRLAGLGAAGAQYGWSKDNASEIQKGWILQGESPAELARKLNMNPDTLEETVRRWNADVQKGRDTLYDRPIRSEGAAKPAYTDFSPSILSAPLEQPPFYGMALYPCLANTQGGPRRNAAAQVVDPYGKPIPGLYSAGELGSMWGIIYQGAGNIAEGLAFGRIAGRNAAVESRHRM
jgi:succinate dehydrogenase/fumarate reductase flavoprotein subunit